MNNDTKECSKCGKNQPYTEFYSNDLSDDGYSAKCNECIRLYNRERRTNKKTRDTVLASDRTRNSSLRRRAQRGIYKMTELEKYPEKTLARKYVAKALRDGTLTKQVCEVCKDLTVEAHHEDYYKPLEINWLCKVHHTKADRARIKRLKEENA